VHGSVTSLPPYRCAIEAGWIDYNGHLRDAYYGVIVSSAIDDAMDHLGLDAAYRQRTRCTLYTLEQHFHFLYEVKASDEITVVTSVLDFDRKRLHVGCRLTCARLAEPAAVSDVMLLHVHQGETPAAAPFPEDVARKLESLKTAAASAEAFAPSSRKIELKRR
jgi:acyl-CoA thioester hydrolase